VVHSSERAECPTCSATVLKALYQLGAWLMKPRRRAVIGGMLLGILVACFGGLVISQNLACHTPQTYRSGDHLGYRVGMTRDDAVAVSARLPSDRRLFAIWDRDEIPSDISVPRRRERFIRSLAELRAPGWRNEEWLIGRGHSWCVFSESDTRLVFEDGRLKTITDELGYDGP